MAGTTRETRCLTGDALAGGAAGLGRPPVTQRSWDDGSIWRAEQFHGQSTGNIAAEAPRPVAPK